MTEIVLFPLWFAGRERLSEGAAWNWHNNPKTHPGVRRWLERFMQVQIQKKQSLEEVITLGNSLRYFSTELFRAMQPTLYAQTQMLFWKGQRTSYDTRTLEILLPSLVEMGVIWFVLPQAKTYRDDA